MKKIIALVTVVLVVAIGGIIVYANRNSMNATPSPSPSTSMSNMPSSSPSPSASTSEQSTNSVTIQNFAFSPSVITIKKGTTVTWTNKDSATHTVTETDGQNGPKSGDLSTGTSYSFTFNSAGTFKYDCSIHTSMTGTVTVTE